MEADLLSADRVRTFLAVIEHGSFSRAAAALGVTQPSVNQQMRRLEEDLGRSLFERSSRGLSPTTDGEAFLLFARAMKKVDARARAYFSKPRLEGRLRLGVSEEFTRTIAPRVLGLFFRQFPNYAIELVCEPSHTLVVGLAEGRHDLIIGNDRGDRGGELMMRTSLKWVGREGVTGAITDPIPLLLPPKQECLHDIALQTLQEADRTWRVVVQSSSLAALIAAAEAGIGVCVVSGPIPVAPAVALDECAGLPTLPDHGVFMLAHGTAELGDPGLLALQVILRSLFAELAVRHRPNRSPPPHSADQSSDDGGGGNLTRPP